MKTKLTPQEFNRAVFAAEHGGFVSAVVMRFLPDAPAAAVDGEINRVYDAAQMGD